MKAFIVTIFGKSWVVFFSGLITICAFGLLWKLPAPEVGRYMLHFQMAFTVPQIEKVLEIWGQSGIDSYLKYIWLDYIFPLGYASFFSGSMALLFPKSMNKVVQNVIWLPIIAAVCDIFENTMHIIILSQELSLVAPGLIFGAAFIALVKWVLSGMVIFIVGWLLFNRVTLKLRGR